MNNNIALILTILYLIALYLFYKYYKINSQIKNMKQTKAICTDVIVRRTYNKKYFLFLFISFLFINLLIKMKNIILPTNYFYLYGKSK